MTFRTHASILRGYGFSVFPTHAPGMPPTKAMVDAKTGEVDEKQIGKCPLVKWKPFQTRLPTDEEMAEWDRKFPGGNIAVCCGPVSGLLVLDLDGIDAAMSMQALEDEHEPLPDTWRVATSRGCHVYFRYDGADLRNTNGELGKGIESKTGGATVHGVGSVHRSGHAYDWVATLSPADVPLADAPEWLLERLRKPTATPAPPKAKRLRHPTTIGEREHKFRQAAWNNMIAELSTAAAGGRNATLFKVAANARRWVNAGQMNAGDVEATLRAHALSIGLQDHEINATLDSARRTVGDDALEMPAWWGKPPESRPRTRHPLAPPAPAPEPPPFDPETGEILNGRANGTNGHAPPFLALPSPSIYVEPVWENADDKMRPEWDATLGYCCSQPHTDLGNARRLAAWFGDRIKYSYGTGWMHFDGTRWRPDMLAVRRLGQSVATRISWENAHAEGLDAQRATEKHAQATQNSGKTESMMKSAEALTGIQFDATEMDADPYLLNTLSGVVDLRTGEVSPHDPKWMVSKCCPYHVADSGDRPEKFIKFILDICCGDDALAHFIQLMCGYALTGDTRHQCLFFFYGEGQNGKSQLLNILTQLLGDYATTDSPDILLDGRPAGGNPEFRMIRFKGARVFHTAELEQNSTLSMGTIKRITGGDKMVGRNLNTSHVEFHATHKVFLMSNTKPNILDQTHGTWRRIKLIPFNARFEGKDDTKDIYKILLEEEGPQILRWMIEGAVMQASLRELPIPTAVVDATAEYKEDEDVLADYIGENLVADPDATINTSDAYDALVRWARYRHDRRIERWSRQHFGKKMEERGVRRITLKGYRVFRGYKLKPVSECPWREHGGSVQRPGPQWERLDY